MLSFNKRRKLSLNIPKHPTYSELAVRQVLERNQ